MAAVDYCDDKLAFSDFNPRDGPKIIRKPRKGHASKVKKHHANKPESPKVTWRKKDGAYKCYCDHASDTLDELATHKDGATHWRCRHPDCDVAFSSADDRLEHEKICKMRVTVKKHNCPVCQKSLVIDVYFDGELTEDYFLVDHPHLKCHHSCWTCRQLFSDGEELELHAVAERHRLHPAQLSLYPSSQVSTLEAMYAGVSRGVGDKEADDKVSKALSQWFLSDHDCKLGPLLVEPSVTDPDERVKEAHKALLARGRTTHLPYLYALSHVIASSHNGNKDGPFGYYPHREGQRRHGEGEDAGDAKGDDAANPEPDAWDGVHPDDHILSSDSDDDSKGAKSSGKTEEPDESVADTPWKLEVIKKTAGRRNQFTGWSSSRKLQGGRGRGRRGGKGPASDDSSTVTSGASSSSRPAVGVEGYLRSACAVEMSVTSEAAGAAGAGAGEAEGEGECKCGHSHGPGPADGEANKLYQLEKGDYNGHNIAAMAVDTKTGRILGCQWNHCHLMKSTAAHAEERLIDRLFATADLCGLDHTRKYNKFLSNVVIYTSLEPCYQCAGKMIMAGLKAAIWLQDDPLIGVSMLKMVAEQDGKVWKTRGYSAKDVFPQALGNFSGTLNKRYKEFKRTLKEDKIPFYVSPSGQTSFSSSVPTFLCSDQALDVFLAESKRFMRICDSPYVRGLVPQDRRAAAARSLVVLRHDGSHVDQVSTRWEAWDYLRSIVAYISSHDYARGGFG